MTPAGWTRIKADFGGVETLHAVRPGHGIPLLFVHGIGPGTTGFANFRPLLDTLPADWPLHLIDLAGFGQSAAAAPEAPFAVSLWLQQIQAALDRIGEPVLLVGNSIGGALVLKASAGCAAVRAVTVIGAPAAPMAPTSELRAFWRMPSSPEVLAAAMRPMTGPAEPPDPKSVAERWAVLSDPVCVARFAAGVAMPEALLDQAVLTVEEASRLQAPVHIIHGRQDRACPAEPIVGGLLPLLSQADLTLIGGCGHNVISERTRVVVRILSTIRAETGNQ